MLRNESIGYVLKDHEGGHWFSTLDHGIYYVPNIEIELLQWNENAKVSCAVSDGNRLYVGNYQGDVTALDAPSKKVLWSKNVQVPINAMFVDTKGNIWVAEIMHLQCFNPSGEQIFSLPMIHGAKCFQEMSDGSVWVGNNTGVYKVSPSGDV